MSCLGCHNATEGTPCRPPTGSLLVTTRRRLLSTRPGAAARARRHSPRGTGRRSTPARSSTRGIPGCGAVDRTASSGLPARSGSAWARSRQRHLAAAYRVAGRTAEAITLLEQTVADRERVLGRIHAPTRCGPGRARAPPVSAALSPGCRMRPRESESNSGYLAGRKATWIWTATPGAVKPSTSPVL